VPAKTDPSNRKTKIRRMFKPRDMVPLYRGGMSKCLYLLIFLDFLNYS
jgi:hypothetical protein